MLPMLPYLEIAGLTAPRSADVFVRGGGPKSRTRGTVARLAGSVRQWFEERRTIARLSSLDDRLLADVGFTREDIPAVVNGTYVRQPESAPIEHPSVRTVRVTGGTASSVANDNEAQIAA